MCCSKFILFDFEEISLSYNNIWRLLLLIISSFTVCQTISFSLIILIYYETHTKFHYEQFFFTDCLLNYAELLLIIHEQIFDRHF